MKKLIGILLIMVLFISCHTSKEYRQMKKTTRCEYEK